MYILLINPPPRQIEREDIIVPPLGLAYIAAVLEQVGHKVEILDAFALQQNWEDFERSVRNRNPDVIGLGGTLLVAAGFVAVEILLRRLGG